MGNLDLELENVRLASQIIEIAPPLNRARSLKKLSGRQDVLLILDRVPGVSLCASFCNSLQCRKISQHFGAEFSKSHKTSSKQAVSFIFRSYTEKRDDKYMRSVL